ADGSGLVRKLPATVCALIEDTSTLARQLTPPSIERNERIWLLLLRYGMITVPLGRTTGWPPSPVDPLLLPIAVLQVNPPLVDRLIRMALPAALLSNSV